MVESWFLDLDQNSSGAAESGEGREVNTSHLP